MSSQMLSDLRLKLAHIRDERDELVAFRKVAFMPSPAMPQGPPPPMDPAMMQQGMPVDPATGMPIDPAMMQGGAPPQGPPIDPATGMPIDPAMMQQGPPPMDPAMMQQAPPAEAPPISPEAMDQMIGLLEEMGQQIQTLQQEGQQFRQQAEQAINDLNEQVMELDQRLAQAATPAPIA